MKTFSRIFFGIDNYQHCLTIIFSGCIVRYLEAYADMPAKIIFVLPHSYILPLYRTDIMETITMHPDISQYHPCLKAFHKVKNASKCQYSMFPFTLMTQLINIKGTKIQHSLLITAMYSPADAFV